MEKATIAEVQKLENDNAKLKNQLAELGIIGHDAIRTLRAIHLRVENKTIREMLIGIGKIPVV